jgi:hypothetical protein
MDVGTILSAENDILDKISQLMTENLSKDVLDNPSNS